MELTSSDILGLMVAARTDKATTERLEKLHEVLAKIEAAKAENEKISSESSATFAQAAKHRAEGESHYQAARRSELALDERERNLADVQATIQADKAAWEKVRQQVDAEQKETAASQAAFGEELGQREKAVSEREADVKAREEAAAALHISATGKMAALHAVLNAP